MYSIHTELTGISHVKQSYNTNKEDYMSCFTKKNAWIQGTRKSI